MPNPDETPTPSESTEQKERTFTQGELDVIVKERLKREREKHSDYDELKAKVEKFDVAEEASKSELQKAVKRAKSAEKELSGLNVAPPSSSSMCPCRHVHMDAWTHGDTAHVDVSPCTHVAMVTRRSRPAGRLAASQGSSPASQPNP